MAANTALYRVRLRLNPNEEPSKTLLRTLDDIEQFSQQDEYPADEVHRLERALTDGAKLILKGEWDRVGQGEGTYRTVKRGLICAVIALFTIPPLALLFG